MKKMLWILGTLLLLSAALPAQDDSRRFEFSLMGGAGLGWRSGPSVYSDTWNSYMLDPVNERTTITLAARTGIALSGRLSYFLTPNFGVQFGAGYFGARGSLASAWHIDWHWNTTGTTSQEDGAWPGAKSRGSSIPLYLNIVARYQTGVYELSASAGPTLFFNSFRAEAYSIYGDYDLYWTHEWIDWFRIPVRIPDTVWAGFGFNAGAGFDLHLSPSLALSVEARYYFCPAKSLSWEWVPGTYTGFNNVFENWAYASADLAYAQERTSPFVVKPSFFSIAAGVKLIL